MRPGIAQQPDKVHRPTLRRGPGKRWLEHRILGKLPTLYGFPDPGNVSLHNSSGPEIQMAGLGTGGCTGSKPDALSRCAERGAGKTLPDLVKKGCVGERNCVSVDR